MHIQRSIQKSIEKKLFQGKVIIVYGPRRTGKTTLAQDLLKKYPTNSLYLSCDEPDIQNALTHKTSTELKHFVGNKTFIVIDEAQRINDIGLTLKLFVDNFPKMQILATGSSSFDLANSISEPLTGRSYEFTLYPFSLGELEPHYSRLELSRLIERFLRFGTYPEAVFSSEMDAKEIISHITQKYLYKDILEFENLKNPELLQKLLAALALQIGNEVSYNELATLLQVNKVTIERYIQLLEKAFVIFRLTPLSRNLRKEIGKMRKIYFYDLGIRNSIIRNFNALDLRTDTGNLWENYGILERMKCNAIKRRLVNTYFWRTYDQKEINYIEEADGIFSAFEFKWSSAKKQKAPKDFLIAYPGATYKVIHKDNIFDLIALKKKDFTSAEEKRLAESVKEGRKALKEGKLKSYKSMKEALKSENHQ